MRAIAGMGLAIALLAGVPAGCVVVMENGGLGSFQPANFKTTRVTEVKHAPDAPVHVETSNGAVTIEPAAPGATAVEITADIKAQTQERLDAVKVVATRDDKGLLKITVEWPEGKAKGNEACAFKIKTPGFKGVTVKSHNGEIALSGQKGDAVLNTSNGRVAVNGHTGPVKANSSNGKIELLDVLGASADSSNGAIHVRLAEGASGPVNIDTSNGAITLEVPSNFNATLDADTSNGRIESTIGTVKGGKGKKTIVLGNGEGKGRLDTSNGAITVKAR